MPNRKARRAGLRLQYLARQLDDPALSPTEHTPPSPSLTRDRPALIEAAPLPRANALAALERDCGEDGPDAVLMAVWASVSAWWGRDTNTWGHSTASILHSDASNRMRGRPTLMGGYPEDKQAERHREAFQALTAWEAKGSPGLLETIEVTRNWAAKIQLEKLGVTNVA